jgi:glutathione synthase/RimK-type ligase-like ATP-grasp enzyme
MKPVVLTRSGGHGGLSFSDYLHGRGLALEPGTRVMIEAESRPMTYHLGLIAEARQHKPLPVPDLLLRSMDLPTLQPGRTSGSAAPRLGVLFDPGDPLAPTMAGSLSDLWYAAGDAGLDMVVIDPSAQGAADIDALFVRTHTSIGSVAAVWAMAAEGAGIPVIDDPQSIRYCCNKLFVSERLRVAGIGRPESRLVASDEDVGEAVRVLGLPLVLKIPDSSFGRGVFLAETLADARLYFAHRPANSPILLAERFTPTEFDWRVGMLNGQPLFACQYFMAPHHWQIIKRLPDGTSDEGQGLSIPLEDVPSDVLDAAIRAGHCLGSGLYGVDIKVSNGQPLIIEINDNPTIESDLEASRPGVWGRIAGYFANRIEEARFAPMRRRA